MKSFTLELILASRAENRYSKGLRLPELTLPVLAALTPPDVDVILTEEEVEDVTYRSNVDLVGISFMTPVAYRAYEIADEYRRQGVKVVLGGMHASALPSEAVKHADAVVIGEAENVWKQVIEDFRTDKLKKFYKSYEFTCLKNMPIPRRDLLKDSMVFSPYSIQTTRGCPHACDFCSVTRYFGSTYRCRPIKDVVTEIESADKKNWLFVDDNIFGNQAYSKKLFHELIPLKIKWIGQSSLLIAKNDELVKLAAKSGCMGLFIGLESLSSQSLKSVNKGFNKVEHYEDCIKRLQDYGIIIDASFIFGLDYDDKHIFEKTVAFIEKNKIAITSVCILTPFPGTKLFEKMEREGRIIERDWSKYDYSTVTYRPKLMSPQELHDGTVWTRKEIFSYKSILKRLPANWHHPLIYFIANLGYHARNKKSQREKN